MRRLKSFRLVIMSAVFALCCLTTLGAAESTTPSPTPTPVATDSCATYGQNFRENCYKLRLKVEEINVKQKLATLNYNQAAQAVNIKLGEAQLKRAPWILGIVIAVLLAGLAMSWLQFSKSLRSTRLPDVKPEDPAYNNFKISLQGIEVQSATVGVAILLISLVFFYLYLTIVYQLHVS